MHAKSPTFKAAKLKGFTVFAVVLLTQGLEEHSVGGWCEGSSVHLEFDVTSNCIHITSYDAHH